MKIKTALIATAALFSISVSTIAPSVSATTEDLPTNLQEVVRDTADTGFFFELRPGRNSAAYDSTQYRKKQNSSSVYEKTFQHSKTYRNPGWVRGSNDYLDAKRYNDSDGHYYDLSYNRKIHMLNSVKEKGHKMAAIAVGADPGQENYIWGDWSPDSK